MTDTTLRARNHAELSPGDPATYLRSGRRLQAKAMGEAFARAGEALASLARRVERALAGPSRIST